MAIHDWTKVDSRDCHDFHQAWTVELRKRLNDGLLPVGYRSLAMQESHGSDRNKFKLNSEEIRGALHLNITPPKVSITATSQFSDCDLRKSQVVIHHEKSQRIVAVIDILTAWSKSRPRDFRRYLNAAADRIELGIHLLLIDLNPATIRDPHGIHGAIWSELGDESYSAPLELPFTLVSYRGGEITKAYLQPVAVGHELPPMPLFLTQEYYVNMPLAETYSAAFEGTPAHVRRILQESSNPQTSS